MHSRRLCSNLEARLAVVCFAPRKTPSLLAVVWQLFQPLRKREDCGVQGRESLTRNAQVCFDLQFLPLTSNLQSIQVAVASTKSPVVEPQRCPQFLLGRRTLRYKPQCRIRFSAQKAARTWNIAQKRGTVTLELKIVWYGSGLPGLSWLLQGQRRFELATCMAC
jgi:hypothetical protein